MQRAFVPSGAARKRGVALEQARGGKAGKPRVGGVVGSEVQFRGEGGSAGSSNRGIAGVVGVNPLRVAHVFVFEVHRKAQTKAAGAKVHLVGVAQSGRNVFKKTNPVVDDVHHESAVEHLYRNGSVHIQCGRRTLESDPLQALPHVHTNAFAASRNARSNTSFI